VVDIQTVEVLVTQIAIFYGFIVTGYLIARLSGKGQSINKNLNMLLINVLVPILFFYSFLTITPTSLSDIPIFLTIALIIHLLGPVLIYLRFRTIEINGQTRGALYICSTFNNALFVPLPIALMFLGSAAISFVVMFSLTQMVLVVTLGSVMGAAFGNKATNWREITKNAVTFPPFLATIISMLLIGLNLRLPTDLALVLSYNSPITTYLALVSVGIGIGVRFSLAEVRTAMNVVAVRQFIIPLLILPIILLSTLSQVPLQVLIIESLMPPAILTVVYASGFDLDVEITSTSVTIGTLLLLPIIPLLLILM
jgi:predicted permease